MATLPEIAVYLIAIQHLGFMVLEMFFWTRPLGHKLFKLKPEFARQSAKLAFNQGLYNGFLAAGLVFGLHSGLAAMQTINFFLCCIIIAGIIGAVSVNRSIFYIQALPSLLVCLFINL